MALDLFRTMLPENGLVRTVEVLAPNGGTHLLWSVAADIGQQDFSAERLAGGDYPLTLVGACGMQRRDTVVRACGEAVERAALMPTGPLPDAPSAPQLRRGALWAPPAAGASASPDPTYAAADLATGEPRRVPVAAVDYPVPDPGLLARFDPTPSGAAAGPTRQAAVAAALREILERDAAMVAWARQVRLPSLDLAAVATGGDPVAARPMQRLLAAAAAPGLIPVACVVPTGVPGADCVIAVVVDETAGLAAAGLAVSDTTAAAGVKALQEALQVRTVLLGVAETYRGTPLPELVDTDLDRARFWTRPAALEAMQDWIAAFGPPVELARSPDTAPPDWASAVPGAAVVDLTPRLPAAIRALGWHAVKVLAPAHQPLRMSERHPWSWSPERLELPEAHWGLGCGTAPGQVVGCPHPFI